MHTSTSEVYGTAQVVPIPETQNRLRVEQIADRSLTLHPNLTPDDVDAVCDELWSES